MFFFRLIYDLHGQITVLKMEQPAIPLNLSSGSDENGNKYNYVRNCDGSHIKIFLSLDEAVTFLNENFNYGEITEQYRTAQCYWRIYIDKNNMLSLVKISLDVPDFDYLKYENGSLYEQFYSYEAALEFLNDYFLREHINPQYRTLRNILVQKIDVCVLCKQHKEQFFIREMCYPCLKSTLDANPDE